MVRRHARLGAPHTFLCTLSFLKISVASRRCWFSKILLWVSLSLRIRPSFVSNHVLLSVPRQERQVQEQCDPVSVDNEEEGEEGMDGGFGHNVGVKAVAKIDGVNIVAGAKKLASAALRRVRSRKCTGTARLTILDRCT